MLRPRTVIQPTAEDEAAYERWVNARPNRYGSALRDAFLAGRASMTPAGVTVPPSVTPAGTDPWEAAS